MTLAHPLAWPTGWERSAHRQRPAFKVTLARARDELYRELGLMGATKVVVSSNARLNLNGTMATKQGWIADPGVAVYFELDGKEHCIPCDLWETIDGNVRAIGLTVAALRGLDRWGTKQMVSAAFAGYAALPEQSTGEAWWDVLGVEPGSGPAAIKARYRDLARKHHPDAGGDPEAFRRVALAFAEATEASS